MVAPAQPASPYATKLGMHFTVLQYVVSPFWLAQRQVLSWIYFTFKKVPPSTICKDTLERVSSGGKHPLNMAG